MGKNGATTKTASRVVSPQGGKCVFLPHPPNAPPFEKAGLEGGYSGCADAYYSYGMAQFFCEKRKSYGGV